MKYFKIIGVVLFLLIRIPCNAQLWIEDFDGSNSTNPPTIDLECGPFGFDYFGIGCCGSGCGPIEVNSTLCNFYEGEDGNFLGGYNTDNGSGCDANEDDETAEWTGIDISSCMFPDKLFLCFEVANLHSSVGNSSNGWDGPSKVTFTVTIDGGTPIELSAIEDQGTNSTPAFDTDCNGAGDGAELDQFMTEYCVQIPSHGALLDLLINVDGLNETLEEIIIDNIAIHCESVVPSSGIDLGCGDICADALPTFDAIPSQCEGGANPLPANSLEGYTGTWSPVFDPNTTTTYTFTPIAGYCLSNAMATVTIDTPDSSTFNAIPNQCAGGTDPLPTMSMEGTPGTWSPLFDPNTTTTYTFTPDANQCATEGTATVTIDVPITSTFDAIPSQCEGEPDPLPVTSLEGHTGSWSPTFDPDNTTLYTFTPTVGLCVTGGTITVTIETLSASTFDAIPSQCAGDSDPLPVTSIEGFTGIWSPVFDPNTTTSYTFTPTAGQCASDGMTTVTIDSPTASTFDAIPSQCAGESDPLPSTSLEGFTGSWSPVFDPNTTTSYTFTPTVGQCASDGMTTVTIDSPSASTFDAIPNQCAGESDPLPSTSLEGFTGSWSPLFDPNTTTSYTFTPTAGQCASGGMTTVTIDIPIASTFDAIPNQCAGESDPLPSTSLEGFTGSWSPVFDPNTTTSYTFTPAAGQCASGGMTTVTIDIPSASTFDAIPSQCAGESDPLPSTSLEGFTGSWSPVFDPNTTTSYTFTPTAGQCASDGMTTVTIDIPIASTFDAIPSQCAGESDPLPSTSLEGFTGSWSPVFDPNTTTSYTFTPTAGQCASDGMTTVTIDIPIASTFDAIPSQCAGESDPLPSTSLEGFTGTWSPVFDPNTTTSYTFTPTAGQCASDGMTTVTIDSPTASTFDAIPNQCAGESDPLPSTSLEGFTGSWSPVFDPNTTTSYIFTPTAGQCASDGMTTVTIDIPIASTFDAIPSQCAGGDNPLLTTSIEGVDGAWSPIFDPNLTGTYTFTPLLEECANSAMLVVTIDQPTNPTFEAIPNQCIGESDPLVNVSNEGIIGNWTPSFDPNSTQTYTFMPNEEFCANTATLTVTIEQLTVPTFAVVPDQCAGGESPLSNNSLESISGMWTPTFDPNITTSYTFNPDAGQCSDITTVTVTIVQPVVPDFMDPSSYCELDEQIYTLETVSGNGVEGTWLPSPSYVPSVLMEGVSVFTFTPDESICAEEIAINITVDASITPDFTDLGPYCVDDTPDMLLIESLNGISGTWDAPISTTTPGTITYTFTPDSGICASEFTMNILVEDCGCTDPANISIDPIAAICEDETLSLSAVVGGTGSTLTWTSSGDGVFDDINASTSFYTPGSIDISNGTVTITAITDDPDGSGPCSAVSDQVILMINSLVTPLFTQLGPYCQDDMPDLLSETSLNGITGTWDGFIDTSIPGDWDFNFTPTTDQCAGEFGMTVVIDAPQVATFDEIPNQCAGGLNPLPTESLEGFSGIWAPVFDPNNTTVYAFIVDAGQCALEGSVMVVIDEQTLPTFIQLGPYCVDDAADDLPPTSLNGIGGTWDGPIETSSPGTSIYTFTPSASECAMPTTMEIKVNDCGCMDPAQITIDAIFPICENETITLTANLSGSASMVTWSSSGDGSYDDMTSVSPIYTPGVNDIINGSVILTVTTDDPDGSGPCLEASANVVLTINAQELPQFTQLGPYCVDDAADDLPLTSSNGINGTWDGPIETTSPGLSLYTFTPSTDECAVTTTMEIEVNDCGCMDPAEISIDPILEICENETITMTANLSGSASMVTWSSSGDGSYDDMTSVSPIYTPGVNDIINGSVILTVTTDDPDGSGPCLEASANVTLTINAQELPQFTQLGPYCVDDAADDLPLTSSNGISGTWDGPIETTSPGLSLYTFIPSSDECAVTTTMEIEVNDCGCMDPAEVSIDPILEICENETITMTANLSGSASMVTWSSSGDGSFDDMTSVSPIYTPGVNDIINGSVILTATTDDPDGSGPCLEASANVVLTINAQELPQFTQLGPYCVDDAADDLPLASSNGISGTWDGPIETTSPGLSLYTFTPSTNECAVTTTMEIEVNDCGCMDPAEVSIDPILEICENETITMTANLSGSASMVIWSSSGDGSFDDMTSVSPIYTPGVNDIINGSVILTVTTDDPDGSGPCLEASANVVLTINAQELPQFTQLGPYCVDDATDDLPLASSNGINGTWDGPIITSSPGSTTYTFTPNNDQCALSTMMEIEVNDCGCANPAQLTIDPISPICENETISLTANLSGSASMVTWSSSGDGSFDDLTSTTPIYTPGTNDIAIGSVSLIATTDDPDGAGPCLEASSNIILMINAPAFPQFTQLGPYCIDETADDLPIISGNGINGTWDGVISTSSPGLTIYTFTPDSGECATSAIMEIMVNDCGCIDLAEVTIDPILAICANETITLTANLAGSASTVSWSSNGDGLYDNILSNSPVYTPGINDRALGSVSLIATTDDPDGSGPCLEASANVTLTINAQELPEFIQLGPYCVDDVAADLPLASLNGIGGAWDGPIVTSSPGSSIYTFTPGIGECGLTTTMEVVVNDCGCMDPAEVTLDPILAICANETIALTANLAGSASTVTWSNNGDGIFDNTSSITPIYTPGANDIAVGSVSLIATTDDPDGEGPCLEAMSNVILMIDAQTLPQFAQLGPYCIDEVADDLPLISTDGISGTWDGSISTISSGVTTYTFTPDSEECALLTSMEIMVNDCGCMDPAEVTIDPILAICENETIALTANLAGSASTVTWSSSGDGIYDNASSITPIYTPGADDIAVGSVSLIATTDDPDGTGPCSEASADITLMINVLGMPQFGQLGPYCLDETPDVLLLTSENGISGTWDGPIITTSLGMSTYTFTPDVGECAEVFTTTVEVENCECGDQPTLSIPCDDNNPCTTNDISIVLVSDSTICVPCIGIDSGMVDNEEDKSISQEISSFEETHTLSASELYSSWTMFDGLYIDGLDLPIGFDAEINTTNGILTIFYESGLEGEFDLVVEVCNEMCTVSCFEVFLELDITSNCFDVKSLSFPSGFTPNGDGVNDVYRISGYTECQSDYQTNELIIWNRWGNEVFSQQPYQNDWDGTDQNGKSLPEGTYYYSAVFDSSNGVISNGYIVILR